MNYPINRKYFEQMTSTQAEKVKDLQLEDWEFFSFTRAGAAVMVKDCFVKLVPRDIKVQEDD